MLEVSSDESLHFFEGGATCTFSSEEFPSSSDSYMRFCEVL